MVRFGRRIEYFDVLLPTSYRTLRVVSIHCSPVARRPNHPMFEALKLWSIYCIGKCARPSGARPVKPSDSEACQTLQERREGAKRPQRARSASRERDAPSEGAKRLQRTRSASRGREALPSALIEREALPEGAKLLQNARNASRVP